MTDYAAEARTLTARLMAMTPDELFAAMVESNRDRAGAFPGLEKIVTDATTYGPDYAAELYRRLAEGWLADGLSRNVVQARLLGIRQAIRKATPE